MDSNIILLWFQRVADDSVKGPPEVALGLAATRLLPHP